MSALFLLLLSTLLAADSKDNAEKPSSETPKAAASDAPRVVAGPNLSSAAARRNENVVVTRIDTDVAKEANIRLGVNYQILPLAPVEANTYSSEHGRATPESSVMKVSSIASGWHAELFENTQNSVFNARTFFQVGGVKPSHQNQYGGRTTLNVRGLGGLTFSFSQRAIRGNVNGNVLVPLPSERTPLATDPALRAEIQRFLDAYPKELPNRPDFDERMLNTNSPQRINDIDGTIRLDRKLTDKLFLTASHNINRQNISSFQFVAGQNPDTELHSQRSRLTLLYTPSASTEISIGAGFSRLKSVLHSEPNAVGPRVRMGYQIEELGPDSHFPINRANNHFRYGLVGRHKLEGGRHTLTFGAETTRYQYNGEETNNGRGLIWFTSNFGKTAIQNFLYGLSTTYEVAVGEFSRGFRSWNGTFFVGDQWKVNSRLQLYFGLRYAMDTTPVEVNGWNTLPYHCDCNNFSPRFHIAYQLGRGWMLRTGYTVSYDQIPQVTYGQVRYNAPHVYYLQIQSPNILNPLAGVNLNDPKLRTSPTYFTPDLVAPYAHQYNLSLERKLGQAMLRFGYFGSRSVHLINSYVENRAEPIAGIPLTTDTVDIRRANQSFYDVKNIVNGGIAYLDGAQASVDLPRWRGLGFGVTYTFSKALDEGADFTSTAANRDLTRGRAQSEYESFKDRKGLSNFDSTHSFLISQTYDLPKLFAHSRAMSAVFSGWQWSSSALIKTGTPLSLFVGSDAPGFGNVDGGPSDRPNILDPSILGMTISHPDIATSILQRSRFGYIVPGERRGNLGKNTFRKSGIANWNGGLTKRWKLPGNAERFMQFRAEAFNLGNHPQFDEPQRNLNAAAFGKITNTLNDGRVFQLGLRLIL